jgi:hypothetical protein
VEAEAKRFEPDATMLTLYLVRGRHADATKRVPVTVDGSPDIFTMPRSMARLHLPPGRHTLTLQWDGAVKR